MDATALLCPSVSIELVRLNTALSAMLFWVHWRKRDRLHHLVYIALDPAHELARLSDGQLLRRTLLILLLLLGLLLGKGKSAQDENGCRGSHNNRCERLHLRCSSKMVGVCARKVGVHATRCVAGIT